MNRPLCDDCGRPLRATAPRGLCPACLRRAGLGGQPLPAGPATEPGRPPAAPRFGDYELLEEIGRGGMGVVHKARQLSLNRIVALKRILGGAIAGRDQIERFRAEARAAARLQHPHIVAIHEVGEHEGQVFFSMEYIDGRNLAEVISDLGFETPDHRRAAGWMRAVAEAVQHAHAHGVLHRDLKPANIILDRNDGPHITDFGLAKRLEFPPAGQGGAGLTTFDPEAPTSLTLSGQVLGSPSYLSPEQAEGRRGAVGVASDVYALGAILYHAMTGRPPFQGEGLAALLRQVVETEPVAPRVLNPSIPRDLETICLKCLEKEPRRRYGSAEALADELGRFLGDEPVRACRASRTERAWRWCRRKPGLAGALGAVVLSAALGMLATVWQMRRAQAGEELALRRAYISDIDLATRALADDEIGRVREILSRYVPRSGTRAAVPGPAPAPGETDAPPTAGVASRRNGDVRDGPLWEEPATLPVPLSTDLRGWEWQYLWMKTRSAATARVCTRSKMVSALTFTADGQRLIVHERQGVTLVYDVEARRPVPGAVQTNFSWWAGFCRATERVAYQYAPESMRGGEIRLWDPASNRLVCRFDYERDEFPSIVFSPDGRRLAASGYRGAVVWDVRTGQRIMSLPWEAGGGQVWTGRVAFSPSGDVLATGDRTNGLVRLYQVPGGRLEAEFRVPGDEVLTLDFSPDGRWLAASTLDTNAVGVWLLPAGRPLELSGQRLSPWALAFHPRSDLLATGDGQTIRLWDLGGRGLLTKLVGHRMGVGALAFSPDGRWLASGSNASGSSPAEVLLWDLGAVMRPPPPECQMLTNTGLVAFERDATSFLALSDGLVVRFDAASLRRLESLAHYGTNNVSLAVSADGAWLAHARTDGTVHLWDRRAGRERSSACLYPGGKVGSGTMRVLANGRLLAAQLAGATLRIWETKAWQEPEPWRTLNAQPRDACVSADSTPDGTLLATGHRNGRLCLWEVARGRPLGTFEAHRQMVMEVAFSPDGRWLASAGWDGALRLWDVRHRAAVGAFGASEAPCYGITFSPDGRRVVNGGLKGPLSVVIWDAATRQHLMGIAGPGAFFFAPRFSPDGRTLAVWKHVEDVTCFWRVPSLAEIDRDPNR